MRTVPKNRPAWTRADLEKLTGPISGVVVVGVRGYFRDSMGEPGKNDFGIYDDALFVVSPTCFATFNGNTDPSVRRTGVAVLKPGKWLYKAGVHGLSKPPAKRYPAFVQAAQVTVSRQNQGDDTGWFGINIHRGGYNTTSSLGCQTVYPDQWEAFRSLLLHELDAHGQATFTYLLLEAQG